MDSERGIGFEGRMPWHLPADLARFRRLTMGHCLIMGRRTYESLAGRTLPGRRIIVLSREIHPEIIASGSMTARSLNEAIDFAREQLGESEAFIAGGGQVYRQALDEGLVDRMYLTLIAASVPTDAKFPVYNRDKWRTVSKEEVAADSENRYPLTFLTLEFSPPPDNGAGTSHQG
jgi:dihydrofolate reductase